MADLNTDNISRPRDGSLGIQNMTPFSVEPKTKLESFDAFKNEIQDAAAKENLIHDSSVKNFVSEIADRNTTPAQLNQAADITENLINHTNVLSETAQEQLVSIPNKIAHHRNADYSVTTRGQKLYQQLAERLPQLTSGEAQRQFLNGIADMNNSQSKDAWQVALFGKIDQNASDGIHSLQEVARNDLVRFIGNTAQNVPSLPINEQAEFQKAAISMLQKTQFPYKFDAPALKEALFVVPEVVRTEEYKKQLEKFEDDLTAQAAE